MMEKVLGNICKVLVNDKGGNLMVLLLDQMLKGGNVFVVKSDNGVSNLLCLLLVFFFIISGVSNMLFISQGDIMD